MKVTSVNIAEKQLIQWKGKTEATGIFKKPVNSIYLESEDVKEDNVIDRKYHGGIDKAAYIYSADYYSFWQEKYPELHWEAGMFGENITIEGFDESQIRIGDTYEIGTAIIKISQPRTPCYKLGIRFQTQKVLKEFIRSLYPGAYVSVIKNGDVKKGDVLKLISTGEAKVSLREVFRLMYEGSEADASTINELLKTSLTAGCASELKKRLKIKA